MCRIVVGKRNENHGYQRNNGKHKQTNHGQRKKRKMEFVIQQIVNVTTEVLRLFANNMILL